MENKIIDGVAAICKILNTHLVEYLIIGGAAVALHGFYRLSHDLSGRPMEKPDLDFWYNPTYDNYYSLLKALHDLGLDVTEFVEEISPEPKRSFFKLETDNYKIDFLPEVLGLSKFRSSFDIAIGTRIREVEIRYLNYDDLITSKKAVDRAKDIEDLEQLKLRRGNR
ncbi:MAG TPA: hypothetical protein VHE34_08595 [Puia sp.]|uniref:hypothetical protein n=1 Tax=Puia sp. TaxID=2045100 RepID=UPI002CFCC48C|nr:hypothetical protein [Puia sp.]HVU95268.1 hypothetical protein [Puia sp.]